MGSNVLNKIVG